MQVRCAGVSCVAGLTLLGRDVAPPAVTSAARGRPGDIGRTWAFLPCCPQLWCTGQHCSQSRALLQGADCRGRGCRAPPSPCRAAVPRPSPGVQCTAAQLRSATAPHRIDGAGSGAPQRHPAATPHNCPAAAGGGWWGGWLSVVRCFGCLYPRTGCRLGCQFFLFCGSVWLAILISAIFLRVCLEGAGRGGTAHPLYTAWTATTNNVVPARRHKKH